MLGATFGVEGAQVSHDPIELTYWSKLWDEYYDMFAKPTNILTHCKLTHHINLIDENL